MAAFSDQPACGDALVALRPSSTGGAPEGSGRASRSEPPARLQGGGLRAVLLQLAASTRLVLVVEISGRALVEDDALIEAMPAIQRIAAS